MSEVYRCSSEENCKLVSDSYEKGKMDAYKELAPMLEYGADSMCALMDSDWCEKHCDDRINENCIARYVRLFKEQKNESM